MYFFRSKIRKSRSYSKDRNKRSKSSSRDRSRSYKTRRHSTSTSSTSSSRSRSKSRRRSTSSSSSSLSSSSTTSVSKSKSASPQIKKETPVSNAPLPRYYGRKRSDQSSSDLEDGSDIEESGVNHTSVEIPLVWFINVVLVFFSSVFIFLGLPHKNKQATVMLAHLSKSVRTVIFSLVFFLFLILTECFYLQTSLRKRLLCYSIFFFNNQILFGFCLLYSYVHVKNFQNQKSGVSLSLQERLKRKRQALLNKQCR